MTFPPSQNVCALGSNYRRKSLVLERVEELCWRSTLSSQCAPVISFPPGAAARKQLDNLHPLVSTSPQTIQIPHWTHALNSAH